jgi:1,4-alpha-glucan branching enzyme
LSVSAHKPAGFLTFTLHAHLPYVVNHGTWPHGMEWLLEAAAETYLPLLGVLGRLQRDGLSLRCNLNISPVLLEQLTHPVFQAEFPRYVERKIGAAREDEAFFTSAGEHHFAETARLWQGFFSNGLEEFERLDRNIVSGFKHFHKLGMIEIITSAATHGYMPLLGTDESVRAQIRTAVAAHERHIGERPRGMWAPECGYRPSGPWNFPVARTDGSAFGPTVDRIGIEQALSESGIEFFFVDTHLIEESARIASPYDTVRTVPDAPGSEAATYAQHRRLYQPYFVAGPYDKSAATTVFPRDPRTGIQVWSGDAGYPADGNYLDFHKKRWPGGHRYWSVTGPGVDMADKRPYDPAAAAERVRSHASHFVHLVWESLELAMKDKIPPILCSPFDAELFGHWWFEGPLWLETVVRTLHNYPIGIELISCSEYLSHYPRAGFVAMHEGSWGAEGSNHVWMNPETSWTYQRIYAAELDTREIATGGRWREDPLAMRIAQQLCRELLLLESSDWQFLITTGAARDYAEMRFATHNDQFNELKGIWQSLETDGCISTVQQGRLEAIEQRDSIFPQIDPAFWATGAHEQHVGLHRDKPAAAAPVSAADPCTDPATEAGNSKSGEPTTSEIPKYIANSLP